MLTRSQSFPARMHIPRTKEKVIEENPKYSLVFSTERIRVSHPVTKRINKQMCFLVDTEEGKEWWSIDEFLYSDTFIDEDVCDWINNKNEVARVYPTVKRKCLLCNRFALKGKTICYAYHNCEGIKANDFIY